MSSHFDSIFTGTSVVERDIEAPEPIYATSPPTLSQLADATLQTDLHAIPWVAEAMNASAALSARSEDGIMQGDAMAPVTSLTTAELHALDDQFIRQFTQGPVDEDDSLDATSLAIDEALDAAEAEALIGRALARDFGVADANSVFAHLDETIFVASPMATPFNVIARPMEFVAQNGGTFIPNLAALFPIHMLAAILNMFQLPTNLPGAWATITLLVHQLFGHLNLLVEGLTAILKCPICLQVMQRPYILECGHVACEHCLHQYFRTTLNAHAALYPDYISRHRQLILQVYFFYNSALIADDRRTLRACILSSLTSLIRPKFECPICRATITRPPIFAFTVADVVDVALMLGVPAPDDIFNVIDHHEWRDFFIVMG